MDSKKKGKVILPYNSVRKHNTENYPNAFQYNTPRGNIPHKVAQATVNRAPNPTDPRNSRQYPKHYRNQEKIFEKSAETGKPKIKTINLYDKRETGMTDGRFYEYPVAPPGVIPGAQPFDYSRNPDSLDKAVRYNNLPLKDRLNRPLHPPKVPTDPNDQAKYKKELMQYNDRKAPNDPGVFRVVTGQNKQVVGVNYHPEGDPRLFQRAKVERLDKKGREQVKEQKKQSLFRLGTWK